MSLFRLSGQARAVKALEGLIGAGRLPSAILLSGIEGCGKARLAHELAQLLVCPRRPPDGPACGDCRDCQAVAKRVHPDVKAVDAAYQAALREEEAAKQRSLRVDTIRHLRRDMELKSLLGGWKVAVIEDAHTLEIEAANALLKILEEPPPKTLWLLVTSQRDRIPKTVLSRCFQLRCSPLPDEAVAAILAAQGVDAGRARELAALCEGSASRALELSRREGWPAALTQGPLGPIAAGDSLPKELYLARAEAELALFALGQRLRLRPLSGEADFEAVDRPLRELAELRRALRANADPRAVLTLAALETQGALAK